MNSQTLMFKNKDEFYYLGRNGTGKCKGLEIWDFNDVDNEVAIQPINSKSNTARCKIPVPKEHIPELIEQLKKFL